MVQIALKTKLSTTTNAETAQQTHTSHKTLAIVKMDSNMILPQIPVPILSQVVHTMNTTMESNVYAMQAMEDTTANVANAHINLVMNSVFAKVANSMIPRIIDVLPIVLQTPCGMEILVFATQDLFFITMSVDNVQVDLQPTKTVTHVFAKTIMCLMLLITGAM